MMTIVVILFGMVALLLLTLPIEVKVMDKNQPQDIQEKVVEQVMRNSYQAGIKKAYSIIIESDTYEQAQDKLAMMIQEYDNDK